VRRAKELLHGVSAEELKQNDDLHIQVSRTFTKMTAALDQMIIDKPIRKIRLTRDA